MAEAATQPGGAVALAAGEEVPQRTDEAAVGQRNGNSAVAPVVVRRHTATVDMRAWAGGGGVRAAAPAAPTQDAGAVARFEQAAAGAKELVAKVASVSPKKPVHAGPLDGKPGFVLTRKSKEVAEVFPDGPPLEYWKRAGGRSTVPKDQPPYVRLEMVYVLKDGRTRWPKQHGDAVCRNCWLLLTTDPNGCSNLKGHFGSEQCGRTDWIDMLKQTVNAGPVARLRRRQAFPLFQLRIGCFCTAKWRLHSRRLELSLAVSLTTPFLSD